MQKKTLVPTQWRAWCLLLTLSLGLATTQLRCSFSETPITILRCQERIETIEVYRFAANTTPPTAGPCEQASFASAAIGGKVNNVIELAKGKSFDLPTLSDGESLFFRFLREGETPYCVPCAEGTQADALGRCTLSGPPWCIAQEPGPEPTLDAAEPAPEPQPEPRSEEPATPDAAEPLPEPQPEPQPEPRPEPQPEPLPELQPEPQPEPQPEIGGICRDIRQCPTGLICTQGRCARCQNSKECFQDTGAKYVCENGLCRELG